MCPAVEARRRPGPGVAVADRSGVCGGAEQQSGRHPRGVTQPTVGKWRSWFVELRVDRQSDAPRPWRPATFTAEQVEDVVVTTLESTPANATHWLRFKMAQRTGLSDSTINKPAGGGSRLRSRKSVRNDDTQNRADSWWQITTSRTLR